LFKSYLKKITGGPICPPVLNKVNRVKVIEELDKGTAACNNML